MREGIVRRSPGLAATVSETTKATAHARRAEKTGALARCALTLHLCFRAIPLAEMAVRRPDVPILFILPILCIYRIQQLYRLDQSRGCEEMTDGSGSMRLLQLRLMMLQIQYYII